MCRDRTGFLPDKYKERMMEQSDCNKTHPDFYVVCKVCGSSLVYIEVDIGFSELSGQWGGVHLHCSECDASCTIYGD